MKKKITSATIIISIIIITSIMLPKIMQAATNIDESGVYYQTREEFLESGVKIEYGEVTAVTDSENDK